MSKSIASCMLAITVTLFVGAATVQASGKSKVGWDFRRLQDDYKIIKIDYDARKRRLVFLLEARDSVIGVYPVQFYDADGVSVLPFGHPYWLRCAPPGPHRKGQRTRGVLYLPPSDAWNRTRRVKVVN